MAGALYHLLRTILTTRNRKMLRLAFSLQNYENTTGIPRGIVEDGMVIVVDGTVTRITMKTMEEVKTNGGPMNLDLQTRVMATTIMDGIILAVMAVAVTVVVVVMGEEVIGTTLCPSKDVLGLMINQVRGETMVSHIGSQIMGSPEAQCPPWHIWLGDLDIIHMEYHLAQQHQRMIL